MYTLLDFSLNKIFHSKILVVSVFVLSVYSLILNITSKSSKTLLLRSWWILGCALFNVVAFIAIKSFFKTSSEIFITLNYILLTMIPLILILIFLDILQSTGFRPKLFTKIYIALCSLPIIFIYISGTFTFNGSDYILAKGYIPYAITYSLLSLTPLIFFIIKLFKKDKRQKPDILLWLFVICYLILMLSTIADSVDYPLAQGKSPRAVFAITLLSLYGVISNAIRYKQIIRSMEYFEIYDELTDTIKRKAGMEQLEKKN